MLLRDSFRELAESLLRPLLISRELTLKGIKGHCITFYANAL